MELAKGIRVTIRLEANGPDSSSGRKALAKALIPELEISGASVIDPLSDKSVAWFVYAETNVPVEAGGAAQLVQAWAETNLVGFLDGEASIQAIGEWPGYQRNWYKPLSLMAILGVGVWIYRVVYYDPEKASAKRQRRKAARRGQTVVKAEFTEAEVERWLRDRPQTARRLAGQVGGSPPQQQQYGTGGFPARREGGW